jgi:hypothetical protein
MQAPSDSHSPYSFACVFYGITPTPGFQSIQHESFGVPFTSAFENLVQLNMKIAKCLLGAQGKPSLLRGLFSQSLLLLDELVELLDLPAKVSWNPSEWLQVVLQCIEHEVCRLSYYKITDRAYCSQNSNFVIIDRTITLSIALHQTNSLEPKLSIDERPAMFTMVNKVRHGISFWHSG